MNSILLNATVSAVISLTMIIGFSRLNPPPQPVFGVVNITEILHAKEKEFTEKLVNPATTEAERKQAMDSAGEFAQQLPKALNDVTRDCGNCLVLLSSAVVARNSDVVDLTDNVKRRLGVR